MTDTTERLDRLDAAIRDGGLTRKAWRDNHGPGGAERVCLLLALVPEVGDGERYTACPDGLMPQWLAHLTPWLDDAGSDDEWPGVVTEYARLVRASVDTMTPAKWRRLDYRVRGIAAREARSYVAAGDAALPAIDAVIALIDREIAGDAADTAASDAASDRMIAAIFAAWADEIGCKARRRKA